MLILFNHEDDVALNHVGNLLSFLFEYDLITIFHAFLDFHSELFTFCYYSFSSTYPAVFCISPTLATTLLARLLHLHLHNTHVYSLHGYTSTFADWAFFSLATFCSGALAFTAVYVPVNVE